MINISYVVKIDDEIQTKQFEVIAGCAQGLKPEMFLSCDEIVDDIVNNKLSKNDKIYFKNANNDTLSMEHMGTGMWIRNAYGLWETEKNCLVDINSSSGSHRHPDNLSHAILLLVRKSLQDADPTEEKENKFNSAMKIVGEV